MKIFLVDILAKAGLVVEGTADFQGTSNALTVNLSDSSTKIATTAFVKGQGYLTGSSPLSWANVTGTPTTLAGYGITDPIVLTSGSYANPSWIASLAWSKITGTPTSLAGYGITDAVPSSRTITINGNTHDLSANRTFNVGTVTSVGLSMPAAFTVSGSPVTGSGTIAVTAAGNASQYIRGDGVLANLPTSGEGGGASVSYYLNGSVNQGTFGGVTYYEMNKTPIIGAGTDFSRNTNGYIASFLTDANDPALLVIPAGNWNFETYFQASSGGGTPSFYIELYKYDGTTFTLIASNSGTPKTINDGVNVEAYFSALAVPQTTLTLTDRLAVRIYVTTAGRTITLHTENGHLCQVITTFTTGLTALNGLTEQVQYFSTGTSGSDFNISSATATHTFNLPTASATNRGALSSADWTTFNSKQNALTNPVTGTGTTNFLPKFTGTSTIGNSQVFDNGTNVGIGTTTPAQSLTINKDPRNIIFIGNRGTGSTHGPFAFLGFNTNNINGVYSNSDTTRGGVILESYGFTEGNSSFTIRLFSPTLIPEGSLGVSNNNWTFTGSAVISKAGENLHLTLGALAPTTQPILRFQGRATGGTTNRFADIQLDGDNNQLSLFAPSTTTPTNKLLNLTLTGNVLVNTLTDAGFRLDVNGTARIQGNLTTNLTAGSIPFIGTSGLLSQNNAQLFWDSTNGRLGLGTTSPLNRLHVRGTAGANTQTTLLQLTDTGSGTSNGAAIDFSYSSGNILNARIGASSVSGGGASLAFATAPSDGAAAVTVMTLTKTANVLVGTGTDNGARFRTVGGVVDFQGTTATDGGQLGAELLTSANWTSTDWTGDFATGFTHTTGNTTTLTNTLAAVVSTFYQITWTVTNRTAGTFTIAFGGYTSGALSATGNVGPRATTTGNLVITPTTDFNGTIVMSIRVVTAGIASVVLRNSGGSANGEIRVFTAGSNTSFGLAALRTVTTGTINAAFANQALANLTSGASNVAVGPNSQEFLTIGSFNSSLGVGALRFNISGIFNTAIGEAAIGAHTSPSSTTAIGRGVLAAITSGTNNTGVGTNAFLSLTTGNSLVALGQDAGRLITAGTNHLTATNSIFIGADSRPSADGNTNEIVIGTSGRGNGTNTVTIGNGSIINNFFSGAINATGAGNFGGILTSTTELRSNPSTGDAIFRMLTSSTEQAAVRANGTKFFIEVGGTERFSINRSTGQVSVTVSTASTSTTTGALISAGGLGVAGAGYFGGLVNAALDTSSGSAISIGSRTNVSTNINLQGSRGFVGYDGIDTVVQGGTGKGIKFLTNGATFGTGTTSMAILSGGQIGIGTATVVASACLQVDSTTQGFLPPRMTQAQRTAIASPADGLMVIQTDGTRGYYVFIEGVWRTLAMV